MMNQTSVSFFLYTVFLEDNYLLYEAGDGIEALSLLKRNKLDAALVDLQMPEMDGLGLLGELKKSLSGNHGDYAHRPGRQRRGHSLPQAQKIWTQHRSLRQVPLKMIAWTDSLDPSCPYGYRNGTIVRPPSWFLSHSRFNLYKNRFGTSFAYNNMVEELIAIYKRGKKPWREHYF